MTLAEILKAVDRLSSHERRQLREYLDQHQYEADALRAGTMNVDAVLDAAAELTRDMTDEEVQLMIAAMNEEYIEPWDESEWKD